MNLKLLLLFFLISLECHASEGVIIFKTNQDVSIQVKRPISGMYNSWYVNDTIKLSTDKEVYYPLPSGAYGSVLCEYPSNPKVEFYVFELDTVIVNYIDGKITFEGDNAEGNQYWNNGLIRDDLNIQNQIKSAIAKAFKQDEDLSIALDKVTHSSLRVEILAKIKRMADNKLITKQFATLLNNYMRSTLANTTLYELEYKSFTDSLSTNKLNTINHIRDSIYLSLNVDDVLPIRFSSLYISSYYSYIYNKLDENGKKLLLGKYTENTFGPYCYWLLAPPKIQFQNLLDVFLFNHHFKIKDINLIKLYEYLSDNFPESEAMAIMRKMAEEEEKKVREKLIIIKEPVESLSDLTEIEDVKGHTLLLDLWATWCMPCRLQFRYLDDLHNLLNRYQNVTPLYISIDHKDNENVWHRIVNEMSGFHLLASERLIKDIKEKVYVGEKSMSIPRYVLIAPNGKVINANLPRPDNIEKLELKLDTLLIPKKE